MALVLAPDRVFDALASPDLCWYEDPGHVRFVSILNVVTLRPVAR